MRRGGFAVGDVPRPAGAVGLDQLQRDADDVVDVDAVEHLAGLDDSPCRPLFEPDQRVASRPVNAGEPQDINRRAVRLCEKSRHCCSARIRERARDEEPSVGALSSTHSPSAPP